MATRKDTNRATKRAPQQSAAPARNPLLTMEQKAAKFDELVASYDAATRERDATRRANEAAAEARMAEREKPTQLSPDHVRLITRAMSQINASAAAMNQLAMDASDTPPIDAQWYLVAIEDMAKVTARRCDFVTELLTGRPDFGGFNEEFDARVALQLMKREQEDNHA